MKGSRLCCEILSYRQKGAAKCSSLYLTSDRRNLYRPLNLGLKLRNKVYKYKEEISSTRYLCPGLILEIKKKMFNQGRGSLRRHHSCAGLIQDNLSLLKLQLVWKYLGYGIKISVHFRKGSEI